MSHGYTWQNVFLRKKQNSFKKLRFDIENIQKKNLKHLFPSSMCFKTKLFHYDFKQIQILFVLLNPTRNYALQFNRKSDLA